MTLTVVVGNSGSGKTTFLNDVHKSHKCIYIRQFHNIRPYVIVSKIPNFDPTQLPYWDIYVREGKAITIKTGGTMAGEFTAGLSGGQRKLLLFELVFQRTMSQSNLLICLDEPFSGVTDDFIPFIVDRLRTMGTKHNILLVTNDHIDTLKEMADNTITVSSLDRSTVHLDGVGFVGREKAIVSLSIGYSYVYMASAADFKFFFDVEVANNGGLLAIGAYTVFFFSLFIASFWGSSEDSGALILVAGGLIAYFCVNAYLLALTDWRVYINEEAEALLHASKRMNKALKTLLITAILLILAVIQFVATILVVDGLDSSSFWVAMLMDSASMTLPFVLFGLYTKMSFNTVDMISTLIYLLMMFCSTTFSPGAGIPVVKELRYLFGRFYFWCMIPGIRESMENCPSSNTQNMLYMILASMISLIPFVVAVVFNEFKRTSRIRKDLKTKDALKDDEFRALQSKLFGTRQTELHSSITM